MHKLTLAYFFIFLFCIVFFSKKLPNKLPRPPFLELLIADIASLRSNLPSLFWSKTQVKIESLFPLKAWPIILDPYLKSLSFKSR